MIPMAIRKISLVLIRSWTDCESSSNATKGKVLLDECIDSRLADHIHAVGVLTVVAQGWAGSPTASYWQWLRLNSMVSYRLIAIFHFRSVERRVGKECRSRW